MEHLTVRAGGTAFHVARTGTGQPLLLLHGWPEFWLTWEPVMARLADRYNLFATDPSAPTSMQRICWR
jgi:pimeloyl-ACP methyl ester carboxylesterase